MKRREFLAAGASFLAPIAAGCRFPEQVEPPSSTRLTARPRSPTVAPVRGRRPLGLGIDRDGFIYASASYAATSPAALIVLLHGAGRSANDWGNITQLDDLFGARNIIVVAPDSREASWDIRFGGYGPDVAFMDRALDLAFSQYAVNPARIALAGFSDGASYALSLGVMNGDLFRSLVAFSPGFYVPQSREGKPRIYVSHGTQDPVLSYANTNEDLVPQLRQEGYSVEFETFTGGHNIPIDTARRALDWFVS